VNDRLNVRLQFCIQIVSNAIQQTPAWEVDGSSRSQEILRTVHNCPILSQMLPIDTILFCFLKTCITVFKEGTSEPWDSAKTCEGFGKMLTKAWALSVVVIICIDLFLC